MPDKHILYGFIFSLILINLFPQIGFFGFLIIFLSSVLMDIDHYFASVFAGNGFSVKEAYTWYLTKNKSKKETVYKWVIPFHSIEFLIIFLIILNYTNSWVTEILFFIFLGFLFHILLDLIELIKYNDPLYLKLSFIYTSYVHYRYLNHGLKLKYLKFKKKHKTKTFK